ncbi:hypothetical protein D3C78_1404540 [compost metagenome]
MIPDAKRIARLVTQTGITQINFDMANVFFRIATGNFLIYGQARNQRLFFGIRAGRDFIDRT